MGLGVEPEPSRFYIGEIWIYIWLPVVQYPVLVGPKHRCAFCGGLNTEVAEYAWRPIFAFGKVIWCVSVRPST